MRTQNQMFDLILNVAQKDKNIKAVLLNGSRANPKAPQDMYQDYDIVYIVTNFEEYKRDYSWLDVFGNRLIMQTPETMREPEGKGHFNWMMLFDDCVRIDLTLIPAEKPELIGRDSDTVVLLDKEGILPTFAPPSDSDYHVKPPSELYFYSCCNEFWWCLQNVAKGIARDELPYAMTMYHKIVLPELHQMLDWYIGAENNFSVSSGKMGKYYKTYLPTRLYEMYLKVYSDADYNNLVRSILIACELFRTSAVAVSEKCCFVYNFDEDRNMMKYLGFVIPLKK